MTTSLAVLLALAAPAQQPPRELFANWAAMIRRAFSVPDPLPLLAAEFHGVFQAEPGIAAERISFATASGMRVPAIVYRPAASKSRAPAIIVVGGHGGGKASWYAIYAGILYARAGAVVLTFDGPGEGERSVQRRVNTKSHDIQRDEATALRLAGLMQTDIMQAVSYLGSRADVDPLRIAAVGFSLGAFALNTTCAIDLRLRACVLAGGGNLDGPGEYWDSSRPMCQAIPYKALLFLKDRAAALAAMSAARGPMLVYNGLEDPLLTYKGRDPIRHFEDLQARAALLFGRRPGIFDVSYEIRGGHRPYFLTRAAATWLDGHIDLPEWTPESIRQMQSTHIGAWVQIRKPEIDPLYSGDDREGGTIALGEHIPVPPRRQLDCFDDAEWEKRSAELTFESWIARKGASPP